MRSVGGFILLAGIGVALFLYMPAPVDSGASRNSLQRLAFSGSAWLYPAKLAPVSRLGSFSPSVVLSAPVRRGPHLAGLETTAAPASQPPIVNDAQTSWRTTVVSTATLAPTELAPRDADARYELVLDIQQQLRHAGCYWGRLDGSWGYATKDAMKEFTDRVNATLPLDEPDYVQLTLIQSRSDIVCGACPAGQSLSASGRCVGLPITAQAKPTNAPQVANTAQKEVLPWKAASEQDAAAPQPLFRPVPNTVVFTEPLPEHMAIGGPDPASVDAQQSAPPIPPGPAVAAAGTATAVLDPNVAAMKQPIASAPKAERRTRPVEPGTPRYNLLLSLGGLY